MLSQFPLALECEESVSVADPSRDGGVVMSAPCCGGDGLVIVSVSCKRSGSVKVPTDKVST